MSDILNQKIAQLKAQGHTLHKVSISGRTFVYRSLNRKEFRDLQKTILEKSSNAQDESAVSESQDQVVARALVEPAITSALELSGLPAGVIVQLFELVMKASGFGGEEPVPEEL